MGFPLLDKLHRTSHRFADVDGRKIFYREAGADTSPALLLLHGFPTSSHMFRDLIPKLKIRIAGEADRFPYSKGGKLFGARGAGRLRKLNLTDMPGDEFRHLEHAHLALAVKYGPEGVIRVDLRSFFLVLKTVLLDVVPELFGELGTRQRL